MHLLDLYLTHLLHRPWRREDLPPLIRYVDDCLVALRPEDNAAAVYERLGHHFRNAGMEPKHGFNKAVVDLRCEAAQWLGYRLRWRHGQLEIRPKRFDIADPERAHQAHDYIFAKFAVLHEKKEGWRNQNHVLRGMIANLAPTLPFVDPEAIYKVIAGAARDAGFEEIWSLPQVLDHWQADYQRWQWVCEHIDDLCQRPSKSARDDRRVKQIEALAGYDPSVPPWE